MTHALSVSPYSYESLYLAAFAAAHSCDPETCTTLPEQVDTAIEEMERNYSLLKTVFPYYRFVLMKSHHGRLRVLEDVQSTEHPKKESSRSQVIIGLARVPCANNDNTTHRWHRIEESMERLEEEASRGCGFGRLGRLRCYSYSCLLVVGITVSLCALASNTVLILDHIIYP